MNFNIASLSWCTNGVNNNDKDKDGNTDKGGVKYNDKDNDGNIDSNKDNDDDKNNETQKSSCLLSGDKKY